MKIHCQCIQGYKSTWNFLQCWCKLHFDDNYECLRYIHWYLQWQSEKTRQDNDSWFNYTYLPLLPPPPPPHNTHRHNIGQPKHASETLDLLCIWCLLHRIYLVCICQLTFGQYKHPLLKDTSIVEEHVCCRQEEKNYVIMRVILVTFMGRVQPPA